MMIIFEEDEFMEVFDTVYVIDDFRSSASLAPPVCRGVK